MEKRTAGGKTSWCTAAALIVAIAAALVLALTGGQARAQDPVYELPGVTPTPTPTPEQGAPAATPTPAPTATPAAPRLMRPFPTVRTAGSYSMGRTVFTRVTVRAPRGARIEATCSGKRCRRSRRTVASSARAVRLTALQRSFAAGTTITIRITSPDAIGKHVEIRTMRGKPPRRRDRCIAGTAVKPVRCPAT